MTFGLLTLTAIVVTIPLSARFCGVSASRRIGSGPIGVHAIPLRLMPAPPPRPTHRRRRVRLPTSRQCRTPSTAGARSGNDRPWAADSPPGAAGADRQTPTARPLPVRLARARRHGRGRCRAHGAADSWIQPLLLLPLKRYDGPDRTRTRPRANLAKRR